MEKQKQKKQNLNMQKTEELKKKIQELALTVDKVEDEKLEVENQLKKALADYHNLLKNSEKRNVLRFFQIKKNLCEELIPSLDAVMMALDASENIDLDEKNKSWLEGIVATLEKINKTMEEIGLEQYIPSKADDFNNEVHEAIAVVQEGEKGKIFDVIQPGYILDDTVIRPAKVVVSK